MWLLRIDSDTGFIYDDPSNDGWRGISVFLEIYNKHGIEALTVVAMSADYLSPFRNYREQDRPYRVMEEVYGVRNHLDWENNDLIRSGYSKYRELQLQSDMQMNVLNEEIKHDLIDKLTKAFEDGDDVGIERLNKRLSKFNETQALFNKNFNIEDVIEKHSVASNGYKLTRIEIDIATRKNSKFVNSDNQFENPDKLGLGSVGELDKTKVVGVAGEVKEKRGRKKGSSTASTTTKKKVKRVVRGK